MKRETSRMIKGATIIFFMVVFCLILLPITIISLYPKDQGEKVLRVKEEAIKGSAPYKEVTVYRHKGKKIEKIEMEQYVTGVVAGEMPSTFETEALRAQAVAARTYACSKMKRSVNGNPKAHSLAPLCDDVHCQVYRTAEELAGIKSKEWMETDLLRIKEAVRSTQGQVMYYQGQLVEQPLFHSSSGGKTENSEDVFQASLPYLRSVDSPYEEEATHKQEELQFQLNNFVTKVKKSCPKVTFGTVSKGNIKITRRSEGGRVETIQIGKAMLSGRELRDILGLRSSNFDVKVEGDSIAFITTGYGHGVGMSQWGANGMAKKGYDYKEILTHYYSGVTVE